MTEIKSWTDSLEHKSKKEIQEYVKNSIRYDEFDGDPMKYILLAKKGEEFFKGIQEGLKPLALRDAERYPERTVERLGAKFEKTSVYTAYDFSNCNDAVYLDLLEEKKKIDAKVKEREELLKTLKSPLVVTNEETGETYKIHPAVKKTTDGLKITY